MTATTAERKRTGYSNVKAGDFLVMVDSVFFPCTDVNIELDPSMSSIAVALESKRFATDAGISPGEVPYFTVRQFYVDPEVPQQCYTHAGIRKWMSDIAERMKPEPGLSPARQQAIWDGVQKFEGLYKGQSTR